MAEEPREGRRRFDSFAFGWALFEGAIVVLLILAVVVVTLAR